MPRPAKESSNNYEVPKGEEDYVHIEIHKKEFDPLTGQAVHKPFIHKTTQVGYLQFLKTNKEYSIEKVLHLPDGVKTPEQFYAVEEKRAKR